MNIIDKRSKLVATIGPSSDNLEMMTKLAEAGMTTIRANFSHGDYEEQGNKFKVAREVAKRLGRSISILLDTKGPEIRVGKMKDGAVIIKANTLVKVFGLNVAADFIGDAKGFAVSYDMHSDVKKGDKVLFDDGKLVTYVDSVENDYLIVRAVNTHKLKTNKRINLPGIVFSLPFLSEKDKKDVIFGVKNNVNYIAASFVNSKENIKELRKLLDDNNGAHIQIIAKIESVLGIENIDEIIKESDAIMVARGDLGLEINYEDVPYYEKYMIRKCREVGKPIIVATQMLDSMESSPQPTRAEVTDVYYATELGADATMLSGESALGDFPVESVEVMSKINMRAEKEFYNKLYYPIQLEIVSKSSTGPRAKIAKAIAEKAINGDYKFALVLSRSGDLLKEVAKFRPNTAIIGIVPNEKLIGAFGITSSVFTALDSVAIYEDVKNDIKVAKKVLKNYGAVAGDKFFVINKHKTTETIY
jgi:pyruvate kinase